MDGAPKLDRVMDGSAWNDFCERLKRAGRLVIDAAPDDAFDRAEGLRYVGRIARHALDNFIERSDPAAPVVGGLPKLGGDNPDYLYASAPLSADHEYRIVGNLGEARYVGIGSYDGEVGSDEGLALCGYLATPELETDAAVNFEIVVSQQEQPGNWLRTGPATTQLMTRQTLLDRRHQRPATFEIERTDGAGGSRPLDPARYLQQLDRAGLYVEGAIGQFLAWTRSFARSPNQIRVSIPSSPPARRAIPPRTTTAATTNSTPTRRWSSSSYLRSASTGICSCATTGSNRSTTSTTTSTSTTRAPSSRATAPCAS
jgi:hypothetical protein